MTRIEALSRVILFALLGNAPEGEPIYEIVEDVFVNMGFDRQDRSLSFSESVC